MVGIGTHPCSGLQKGVVANMDRTVDAIGKAVEGAQIMAGVEVDSAYVSLAGAHINGTNSTGIIAVKNQEITAREIERVIEAARVVALPEDREIIHVLPQEFVVDDQGGILEPPLGMSATRLEAKVHIVTVAMAAANNIIKCVNKAGFEVEDIVLEQLAVSEATLNADEREVEGLIIDIGGGKHKHRAACRRQPEIHSGSGCRRRPHYQRPGHRVERFRAGCRTDQESARPAPTFRSSTTATW